MSSPLPQDQQMFDAFRRLRTEWPRRGWSWDSRLSCIASSFGAELEATAREVALKAFTQEWTSRTLATAPQNIRDLAERCGGLRTGQGLFSGVAVGRVFGYGLWWPWGDGVSISLRVGLSGVDDNHDMMNRFRDVFGISM
jgi:hypothetical protein